jgi:hypothetical protein
MKNLLVEAEIWLGKLANAVGAPGMVKDGQYRSALDGTHVSVKRGCLYTVISVNGVDVYFRRFGGELDGVVLRADPAGSAPALSSFTAGIH